MLAVMEGVFAHTYQAAMQASAWSNIPILNEWRRQFPKQDPIQMHEKLWTTRLTCPGGGSYVWNDDWATYESTIYGHPGQPKAGPLAPKPLADATAVNLGLTFERNGLRAKGTLYRKGATNR